MRLAEIHRRTRRGLTPSRQEQSERLGAERNRLNREAGTTDHMYGPGAPPLKIQDPILNDRNGVAGQIILREILGIPIDEDELLLSKQWAGGYPAIRLPEGTVSCRTTVYQTGLLLVGQREIEPPHFIPDFYALMVCDWPACWYAGWITYEEFMQKKEWYNERTRPRIKRPCWGVRQAADLNYPTKLVPLRAVS